MKSTDQFKIHEDFLLILPESDKHTLDNSITVKNVVADRRKIVTGTVLKHGIAASVIKTNSTVYYPMYSADEIVIGSITYHIVNKNDIRLWTSE